MGYIALDSNFYYELLKKSKPLTRLEACFMLTNDLNYDRKKSIKFYSKQWRWSRHKTRDFIKSIKSEVGSVKDGRKNTKGHPIHMVGNGSQLHKDTHQNQSGHPVANDISGFQGNRDTCDPKRTPETIEPVGALDSSGHLLYIAP